MYRIIKAMESFFFELLKSVFMYEGLGIVQSSNMIFTVILQWPLPWRFHWLEVFGGFGVQTDPKVRVTLVF